VSYFLLVYERPTGTLRELVEYTDSHAAMRARFEREERYEGDRDVEVVVLGASSLEQVKRTHGRYFMSASADVAG
jgi:hypothetical protein